MEQVLEVPGPADIVVETRAVRSFIIMRIRSYLLKEQLQLQFTEHHFVYFYEVMINCYPNFITCLYFSLALIRWNSSHCQLVELFKSKENFKEKVDLGNNWKTAWPRIILELRVGSRATATSKIERFVIIVNGCVNYYHKALHLGCCSSPRPAFVVYSDCTILTLYVLNVWSSRKFYGCSVSWNNLHINFGTISCYFILLCFLK